MLLPQRHPDSYNKPTSYTYRAYTQIHTQTHTVFLLRLSATLVTMSPLVIFKLKRTGGILGRKWKQCVCPHKQLTDFLFAGDVHLCTMWWSFFT